MTDRPGTFRSLHVRNYRLFWTSQLVSQLGTWMRLIGMSWLVLTDLGGGGTAVGFVAAAQFAPTLFLGAWAGVLTDRRSALGILRVTQAAMALLDLTLVALVLAGSIDLWMVFLLTGVGGTIAAFDNPSRQALVSELVEPDLVSNAVALNSMGFNGARIVGPAIAGGLIQVGGTSLCFMVDAVSYLVALCGLVAIDGGALYQRDRVSRAKHQIRDGLRYAISTPVLRATLLTMAVVGTLSMNFTVLVPLLAKAFTSTAGTFGLLSAAMGVGSLGGSFFAARRSSPTLRDLGIAAFALATAMAAVAASPTLVVAMVAIAFAGASVITYLATTNSLLQLNARSDMRGRVLALYVVLFVGTSPVGGPLMGWIAQQQGIRASVVIGAVGAACGGVVCLLGARSAGAELDEAQAAS